MSIHTPIRPAEGSAVFSAFLPSLIGQVANAFLMRPRYRAVGGMVETIETGAIRTPRSAREWLGHWVEDALNTDNPEVADVSVLHVAGLIHAIREAEGRGPVPPSAANEIQSQQEQAA